MAGDAKTQLPGSEQAPRGVMQSAGRVQASESITVSLYLKDPAASGRAGAAPAAAPRTETRAALRAAREADHAEDFAAVARFADQAGLKVVMTDPARRLVQLQGPASAMEAAFGTELQHYKLGAQLYRGREGALHLPSDLVDRVSAVLGLDTRPIATPKIVPHAGAPATSFLPTEVAALYGFGGLDASGQCIAIVELGGGFTNADNQAAFKAMNLAVPTVVAVPVDGGTNSPGDPNGADGEVALDIQVAGGFAPGARIAVYFAPNTTQGFVDAISQAVHDEQNKPSVISISWGSAESNWQAQELAAMGAAFKDAATVGVTVFAASGDSLATDGVTDGKAHVDYPASDPYVLGCGGTNIAASGGSVTAEVVWKSNGGGTGGGVSDVFPLPDYQAKSKVPKPKVKAGGRGVPDIAGDADPESGFRIVVDGKNGVIGGTSAVAPLWAGLTAALNAARGAPLGYIHATLYANPKALKDITSGDNKAGKIGFKAKKGWDPCTGLGSPDAGLRALLSQPPAGTT